VQGGHSGGGDGVARDLVAILLHRAVCSGGNRAMEGCSRAACRLVLDQVTTTAHEDTMSKTIALSLTEEELEMLVDALEVDLEGYVEAAKEARGNNARDDVETFKEAALNIQKLMTKLRELLPEE
jgi:hypothetical protein